MARTLTIQQADLTVELRLDRPDFLMLNQGSTKFVQLLYPLIERYGVTANEVTMFGGVNLGERNTNVAVHRLLAGVKLMAGRIDVGFNDLLRVALPDVQALLTAAVTAYAQLEGQVKVGAFVVTLNLHGALEGGGVSAFLNQHLQNRPEGLGPNTGGAVGFYHGVVGPRSHLAVILDGSAIVQDGLYVRLNAGYDARKIKGEELLRAAKQEAGKSLAALGLKQTQLDL